MKVFDEHITAAENIVQECCNIWQIPMQQLRRKSRNKMIVCKRQVVSFILKNKFNRDITLKGMGLIVGYKDHSDFIRAYKRAEELLSVKDDTMMNFYNPVKHLLHEQ